MKAERSGIVWLAAARRPLSEEKLQQAIGAMAEDDPRRVAVLQLLHEELGAAMIDASSPASEPHRRAHAGGRMDAVLGLVQRLQALGWEGGGR